MILLPSSNFKDTVVQYLQQYFSWMKQPAFNLINATLSIALRPNPLVYKLAIDSLFLFAANRGKVTEMDKHLRGDSKLLFTNSVFNQLLSIAYFFKTNSDPNGRISEVLWESWLKNDCAYVVWFPFHKWLIDCLRANGTVLMIGDFGSITLKITFNTDWLNAILADSFLGQGNIVAVWKLQSFISQKERNDLSVLVKHLDLHVEPYSYTPKSNLVIKSLGNALFNEAPGGTGLRVLRHENPSDVDKAIAMMAMPIQLFSDWLPNVSMDELYIVQTIPTNNYIWNKRALLTDKGELSDEVKLTYGFGENVNQPHPSILALFSEILFGAGRITPARHPSGPGGGMKDSGSGGSGPSGSGSPQPNTSPHTPSGGGSGDTNAVQYASKIIKGQPGSSTGKTTGKLPRRLDPGVQQMVSMLESGRISLAPNLIDQSFSGYTAPLTIDVTDPERPVIVVPTELAEIKRDPSLFQSVKNTLANVAQAVTTPKAYKAMEIALKALELFWGRNRVNIVNNNRPINRYNPRLENNNDVRYLTN